MNELVRLLRLIPARLRILAIFFMLLPAVFIICRMLGMPTKIVFFVLLGLLAIGLLLLGFNFLLKKREKKRAQEFEDRLGVEARQTEVSKEEIQEALRELEQSWREAVIQLKEAGLSIYDLPWYLLIGEPQSGKSTTLKNSGIEFPVGADALSGAGGTRNCDWWFTNEGVILDTAGRFTFQEDMAPDRHEWDRFLGLLRQHRKHCPINGVIVVIPTTSLLEDSVEEQEQKAKNIRKKLLHLQKLLEIRFPVFVLVTKADRILGFTEHFHRLDPQTQLQMIGWSNPDADKAWNGTEFPSVFGAIVERIHKLRLRLLREETNPSSQDKLFVFPEELDALQEPLAHYFHTIFATSRFEEPFMFRGFYFTSGVQQGRPIARACRDLLRVQVGDPQGVLEDLESVFTRSRAFFIRDFYDKKLFPEQGLVSRTRASIQKESRYRLVLKVVTVAASAIALLLLVLASVPLYGVLRPVNETVKQAGRCLEANTDCTLAEASELIRKTEEQRQQVRSKTFVLRSLLRGRDNDVTDTLLPAVQAGLFRKEVLPDLLESFERRTGADLWREGYTDYPLFRDAYRQLLRFRTYQDRSLDVERREALRRGLDVDPIVRFCRQRAGVDATAEGKAIDRWLEELGIGEGGRVPFGEMLAIEERFDVARLEERPEVDRTAAAFRAHWTVAGLAPWESRLREHFETFETLQRRILDIDLDPSWRAQDVLVEVSRLAQEMGDNLRDGGEHMQARSETVADELESLVEGAGPAEPAAAAGDPLALGDPAPGWQAECQADFTGLGEVLPSPLDGESIERHCGEIPRDWDELERALGRYEHLYQAAEGQPAEGQSAGLVWSEPAARLQQALADLGGLAAPEEVERVRDDFADQLRDYASDSARRDAISRFYERQREELRGPVEALEELARGDAPAELDLRRSIRKVEELSALAVALRVLPPVERFFIDEFDTLTGRLDPGDAEVWVPAASDFLKWSRDRLRAVSAFDEVRRPLEEVDNAQLAYLEDLVREARPASESGDSFSSPRRALSARDWSEFVGAIRDWRPINRGSGRSRDAEGVTLSALKQYARDNDLVNARLGSWQGRLRPSTGGGGVGQEIQATASEFQQAVRGLSADDPVEAWRRLAADAALLAGFQAPSRRGLGSGSDARDLKAAERAGVTLLSDAIRPLFARESNRFWRDFDSCCRDRFPFISQTRLRQGAGGPLAEKLTAGRRVVVSSLEVETVERENLEDLFGMFRDLEEEFALGPILAGKETAIDFVGRDLGKLRLLERWQGFLFGDGGGLREQEITIRLVDDETVSAERFIGKRIGRINFFGSSQIRPTNPQPAKSTLVLNRDDLLVSAVREGTGDDWESRLLIRGGPLKLFYFLLARGEPRRDGQTWRLTLDLPDYSVAGRRLEGRFDFTFDRPLPGVLTD